MKDFFLKLPNINLRTGFSQLFLSVFFLTLGISLKPATHYAEVNSNFEKTIPRSFGQWMEIQQSTPQVSLVSDERSMIDELYDDTLMRTYVDKEGNQIMVALAYAKEQRQDVKIHQPDVCYPAQGYQLQKSQTITFSIHDRSSTPIIGKRQLYYGQNHLEAVSYWIRVGDETMTSGLQMRLKIIKDGLIERRIDDGILVRVSSVIPDVTRAEGAYQLQEKFLTELVRSVDNTFLGLLIPNG